MGLFILRALGIFFLIFGVIGILTPIPFGIVFLILGFVIMLPISPGMVRYIQNWRSKSDRADRVMRQATNLTPKAYRRYLRKTETRYERSRW